MELKNTLKISILLYLAGVVGFAFWKGNEPALWFAFGGVLALVNVFFAAFVVRKGLESIRGKPFFLGLLFFKSLTFLMVVTVTLMFLKPQLLPFTLGIGVVIVGAVGAAFYEIKRFMRGRDDEVKVEENNNVG